MAPGPLPAEHEVRRRGRRTPAGAEGAAVELDGEAVPVRAGTTVMIRPGVRHRAVGRMRILNVVVPPFDAPWVRTTVITDPGGATFTANKFVPENRDLGSA